MKTKTYPKRDQNENIFNYPENIECVNKHFMTRSLVRTVLAQNIVFEHFESKSQV